MKRKRYEVLCAGEWVACKKAEELSEPGSFGLIKSGWLHYELSDGTNGLAQPKKWRENQKDITAKFKEGKQVIVATVLVSLLFAGTALAQEKAKDEYANSAEVIKQQCTKRWPEDFKMRVYCKDQQVEALQTLKEGKPFDIADEDYAVVHKNCATRWTEDYRMRAYCEGQQFEALRKLEADE